MREPRSRGRRSTSKDVARLAEYFAVTKIAAAVRLEELYGRSRHDIVPADAPEGELVGLYAQA